VLSVVESLFCCHRLTLPPRWNARYWVEVGRFAVTVETTTTWPTTRRCISRSLRLALLAPDLVEAVLRGSADQQEVLQKLEPPLPVAWEEQRQVLLHGGSLRHRTRSLARRRRDKLRRHRVHRLEPGYWGASRNAA